MATRRREQLKVTAHLRAGLVLRHPPQLDALLSWVFFERAGHRYQPAAGTEMAQADIPLALSDCGRFWLCSAAIFDVDAHELHHKHRRAPWVEYARLGTDKIRKVQLSLAENKSYRVPFVITHTKDDTVTWYAVGDAEEVRGMLDDVRYLGRFRGAGKGRVVRWDVDVLAETWKGFPILRGGQALRPLPEDVAPESPSRRGFATVRPPYWDTTKEEPCLLPENF